MAPDANFVVSGVLVVACAVGLRRALHPGRGGTWGPWLVGVYGVGLIVAGVFSADPGMGFPAGAPEGAPPDLSVHAILHGVGAALAFNGMAIACLVFARRFAAVRRWGWVAASVATAVSAVAIASWPRRGSACAAGRRRRDPVRLPRAGARVRTDARRAAMTMGGAAMTLLRLAALPAADTPLRVRCTAEFDRVRRRPGMLQA